MGRKLTPAQRARLDQLEAVIRDGKEDFIKELDRLYGKVCRHEPLTEEEQRAMAMIKDLFGGKS